jgi:hypothetical protein
MNTEARMQPIALERLRSALEELPRDHDFLAEYINESQRCRNEEDIFNRLAFRDASFGAGVSSFSEMYEPLSLEDKTELRRRWHEKNRREAYRYDDLRARLSWRYLV